MTLRDENGTIIRRQVEIPQVSEAEDIYILPNDLRIDAQTENSLRYRGIYEVPVYTAQLKYAFDFNFANLEVHLEEDEVIVWDQALMDIRTQTNRSIRGAAQLTADDQSFDLNPLSGTSGIRALVGDPRDRALWNLELELNGAETLEFAALGRQTWAQVSSDWPHPSFKGNFLPTDRTVTEEGFVANWSIPHLARNIAQSGRGSYLDQRRDAMRMLASTIGSQTTFSVEFFKPNSFYKKAYSASQYSLLFIGLTFLTVMLMTSGREQGVHPVQYLLIGLAKAIFVILMLAYSEHLGFNAAFAVAAGATIALLTLYGWSALKLGVRTWVLFALLVLVYAIQFLILQSQDFALLAGGTLAFVALAGAMYFTRNEQWFQPPKPGEPRGWFRAAKTSDPQISAGNSAGSAADTAPSD